jgi:zinc protease
MFNYNGPMILSADLTFDASTKPETVLEAIDTVVELLRSKPVEQKTLERSLVKLRSNLYDTMGQLGGLGLMDLLASLALFDDDPSRVNLLDAEFRKVTPEVVRKTAQEYLRPGNRTVVMVEPGPRDTAAAPTKNR